MADVKEWTNSALTCLERCGEQFRRRIINGERVRPTFRMAKGSVVHITTNAGLTRKMGEPDSEVPGELPSVEEMRDMTADAFERYWDEQQPQADEADLEEAAASRIDAKDFSIGLAVLHLTNVAPTINPVAVERTIVVKPQDSDLVIRGTLDIVDATPEGEIVADTKTSAKTPAKDTADTSQQLDVYGLIRYAEKGEMPVGYRLDYLIQTPKKAERKVVQLRSTRTAEDLGTAVHRINVAVDAVKKGVFIPTAPDSWWCGAKWCEFHSPASDSGIEPCVYVKRGNRPQS